MNVTPQWHTECSLSYHTLWDDSLPGPLYSNYQVIVLYTVHLVEDNIIYIQSLTPEFQFNPK